MAIRGFIMTAEVAQEFFQRCMLAEAVTEPERLKILADLVQEKMAETFVTDMTEDEVVGELSKNANVYRVSKRRKD